MEDPGLREIFNYIYDAFISRDFDYFYKVIDYYNENYNEDVIFHILEICMNKITDEGNDADIFNELLNYLLEKIDINRVSDSGYTPASIMITIIFKHIRARWAGDPEDYYQFIDILFNQYVDMNAGEPSINNILEITEPGQSNTNWCKNEIKKMINFKKSEISENIKVAQAKSLVSSLNPVLGIDSPLNLLDIHTMDKLYNSMILPKSDISRKIIDEYTLDPLVKAKQRLAFAKGFSDPNSSIHIGEVDLRDNIGNLVSRHRPYPSVQKRFMLENKPKTKKSRKFAKRTKKK